MEEGYVCPNTQGFVLHFFLRVLQLSLCGVAMCVSVLACGVGRAEVLSEGVEPSQLCDSVTLIPTIVSWACGSPEGWNDIALTSHDIVTPSHPFHPDSVSWLWTRGCGGWQLLSALLPLARCFLRKDTGLPAGQSLWLQRESRGKPEFQPSSFTPLPLLLAWLGMLGCRGSKESTPWRSGRSRFLTWVSLGLPKLL